MAQSARMGIFTRMSGITRFGRPVYHRGSLYNRVGEDNFYLFYWEATKRWLIGYDYTQDRGNVQSIGSDAPDAYLVPFGWMESKGGGQWQANPAITVVCTSTESKYTFTIAEPHSHSSLGKCHVGPGATVPSERRPRRGRRSPCMGRWTMGRWTMVCVCVCVCGEREGERRSPRKH